MDVWEALRDHGDKPVMKMASYPDAYHRHLARFQNQPITFVEIGVLGGGSLQMWRRYLGDKARIVGVDIAPDLLVHDGDGGEVVIGDQADAGFLVDLANRLGPIDVLIDDGGHHAHQQITTFETIYPCMSDHGVYVCEDVHTSYLPSYKGSFMEYAKGLLDELHGWYGSGATAVTRSTRSIHVYPSVVFLERSPQVPPVVMAWANGDEVTMPMTDVTTLWSGREQGA